MLIWPADLPTLVLVEGFTDTMPDGRLFTDMESGPPKVRRRYSAAVRPFSCQFVASGNDRARVERFWMEDCKGGTQPFLITDQRFNGLALADASGNSILDNPGNVITVASWQLVIFAKTPPTFQRRTPTAYLATIPLLVMP